MAFTWKSQLLICWLGRLLFVQRWDCSPPHPWHNWSNQWWLTSEIRKTSEVVFWYDACSTPAKKACGRYSHPEEPGRRWPSGAADRVTCCELCCFLGLCPRSVSALGERGCILGVGFFFPSEFGCNRNFSEISHGVSGYAKWVEAVASNRAVVLF